jgi:hypothetical protein
MDRRRTFVMAALVVAALVMATFAITQTTLARGDNRAARLLGAWNVEVTTVAQGTTFPALLTFMPGGSMIADEPPSAFETSGHGNWAKRGDRVAFTFVALIGSAEGPVSARLKVIGTLRYDPHKDRWMGPFKIDVTDPAGNLILADSGTFTLTRIAIESLE